MISLAFIFFLLFYEITFFCVILVVVELVLVVDVLDADICLFAVSLICFSVSAVFTAVFAVNTILGRGAAAAAGLGLAAVVPRVLVVVVEDDFIGATCIGSNIS